jgi:very-short-patch-repair endonuclease
MAGKSAKDLAIAALAADHHGVVSRSQLLQAGLTRNEIDQRIASERLQRVWQGVYAVGHRVLTTEGRWMAAVLAGGEGAVLSHLTAAAAWGLRRAGSGVIHVTVPGWPGRKRRPGLKIHRSTTLTPADTTALRGIPVTSPARTIVDVARTTGGRELERLLDLADQRGLVDFADLHAGPASLRAVLRNYRPAPTRSELEEAFLRLCDDHGIPRPETNVRIEGFEVDFVWRDRRLIVEVDGFAYHRSPHAFETDRARDVHLTTKGWRVLRFTWRHVTQRAAWVAAMTKKA